MMVGTAAMRKRVSSSSAHVGSSPIVLPPCAMSATTPTGSDRFRMCASDTRATLDSCSAACRPADQYGAQRNNDPNETSYLLRAPSEAGTGGARTNRKRASAACPDPRETQPPPVRETEVGRNLEDDLPLKGPSHHLRPTEAGVLVMARTRRPGQLGGAEGLRR